MTDDIWAEGRAAREEAETLLDRVVAFTRDELNDVPLEARFDMVTLMLLRQTSPSVLAAGWVVAVERLITREQLDQGLSEH